METIPFEKLQGFQIKLFRKVMPLHGFAPREKQIELADEILCAMRRMDIMFAEAEVGTGKTLAYLLPTVLMRRGRVNHTQYVTGHPAPIVIATSSIALQNAIVRDYIPVLSDILMEHGVIKTPLTATLRKGKGNYLCERRLVNFIDSANQQTRDAVAPLMKSSAIDLAAVKGITPYISRRVCVDHTCGRDCPKHGNCRYTRHMREVNQGGYDFQVVNHNYFLADLIHKSGGKQPLMPEYQAVVIDEAHKFLDAARDMYGAELALAEIIGLVREIRGFTFSLGVQTADIIHETDKIQSKSNLLFRLLNREAPAIQRGDGDTERYTTNVRTKTEKVIWSLKRYADALDEMLGKRPVMAKYESRRKSALRALSRIRGSLEAFIRHREHVCWLEEGALPARCPVSRDCRGNVLRGIPKHLGILLYRDLWSQNIPIILTSGTLSAGGSFEHMKKKLGLDIASASRIVETTKPSPFDHKKNALLYISERTPFPDTESEAYLDSIASEVKQLISASHGHAVVLFTSYKAMELVHERIAAQKLPYPIFRLNRGSGANVIEKYKRSGNGMLFASGALWEGIDIPGDILSMLIIVRLPFPVPDPVSEWERTLYGSMDEYKRLVITPEMLVKLKQAFGRLIRIETDTGVVAILDCRAGEMWEYHHHILRALPPCRVTKSIRDVETFILENKEPAYFEESA